MLKVIIVEAGLKVTIVTECDSKHNGVWTKGDSNSIIVEPGLKVTVSTVESGLKVTERTLETELKWQTDWFD